MPRKGYKQTEAHRRAISESMSGVTMTPEHRAKLAAAKRKMWSDPAKKAKALKARSAGAKLMKKIEKIRADD